MFILEKFSFTHIFKLILNNLIFRSLLLILFILFIYMGVDDKISSYFITGLILLSISYCFIKAKKKVEHFFTFSLNLLIICSFWYVIGKGFNLETAYLFMGSYIMLGLEDFDLSADVESILGLHFHQKCIGSTGGPPGGPGGDGGPDLYPLLFVDMDRYGRDYNQLGTNNDYNKLLQNNPVLDNYKQYIEYEGFKYKVSSIETDLHEYNKSLVHTDTKQLLYEKQKIEEWLKINKKYSNCIHGRFMLTPLNYINALQSDIYDSTLEYNTLKKAKLYYENEGVNLSKDCEDAFEIWRKRQLGWSFEAYFKLKTGSLGYHHYLPNWYDDGVLYKEVRENLLFIELHLILSKTIYDGLNAARFNYFNLNLAEFDDFVSSIVKSHGEKYKESYNLLNKYNIEKLDIYHMTISAVDNYYKHFFPFKFKYKQYNNGYDFKFYTYKVGFELVEDFSKKQFSIYDFKTMSKHIFPKYANKYYGEKVGLGLVEDFSKKKFNFTSHKSNLRI